MKRTIRNSNSRENKTAIFWILAFELLNLLHHSIVEGYQATRHLFEYIKHLPAQHVLELLKNESYPEKSAVSFLT